MAQKQKISGAHNADSGTSVSNGPTAEKCPHILDAIKSLLEAERDRIDGRYTIDPCCGNGDIPKELHRHGVKSVHGSDEQTSWPNALSVSDYRSTISMWRPSLIISSPQPEIDCGDLIACAWEMNVEAIYLLLPLTCLTSRRWIRGKERLCRLWILNDPAKSQNTKDVQNHSDLIFGWFVFERDYEEPTWSCGYLSSP